MCVKEIAIDWWGKKWEKLKPIKCGFNFWVWGPPGGDSHEKCRTKQLNLVDHHFTKAVIVALALEYPVIPVDR